MKVLFIGDIVGSGGRRAVKQLVPELKKEYNISFVIANAENCAAGNGMTSKCLAEMDDAVDIFTSGDHTWDQKGFELEIDRLNKVVRPANFSARQPGVGCRVVRNPAGGEIAVIALSGRVFMRDSACDPFETADKILDGLPPTVKNIFVDIHAEATSEKLAMAAFLDGRVTAVIGTHTHVQTNDARVLPGGTAALTDVGMTGACDSILGRSVADVLYKFTVGLPRRLEVVETGMFRMDCAVVEFDHQTGRAKSMIPLQVPVEL